jgi:hypothetical protein
MLWEAGEHCPVMEGEATDICVETYRSPRPSHQLSATFEVAINRPVLSIIVRYPGWFASSVANAICTLSRTYPAVEAR